MTIILTHKEFELLTDVNNHEATEAKPFKVVSVNNKLVAGLLENKLIDVRPKAGNPLMQELAITAIGVSVINNEIDHELVTDREQTISPETTETNGVQTMTEATENAEAVEMANYVIEDNVPMPEQLYAKRKPRENSMPLHLMQIGQSFLVPFKDDEDQVKGRKRVTAVVSQTKKRRDIKDWQFKVGVVENGYRVWRTA